MKAPLEVTIPLKAQGSQNARLHWAVKAKTVQKERGAAMLATAGVRALLEPVLLVTLTRIGPRELDFVNLCACLKGVQDGVASRLQVDDASPLVKWEFRQEAGEYGVRIRIEALEAIGARRR